MVSVRVLEGMGCVGFGRRQRLTLYSLNYSLVWKRLIIQK